jgi:valyl-tRNA synthetase
MKVGKRLVTKLFNAGKFVLAQGAPEAPIAAELDRAFVERLRVLVAQVTASFDEFEYAHALQETETFFWRDFTDTYLELVKARARSGDAAAGSAVATLRLGLRTLLRMFAPVLPYVTEEVWSWAFAAEASAPSIHRAPWPAVGDFAGVPAPADAASFDAAVTCLAAINKSKSESGVSVGRGMRTLSVAANAATRARLEPVATDVMAAARAERWDLTADAAAADGTFRIAAVEFAEQEA